MSLPRVVIAGSGGAASAIFESRSGSARGLAMALGSAPFERVAMAEAAMAAASAQGGQEVHACIAQAVEAFMRAMPYAEGESAEKALAEGRPDMARLVRLMVSIDDVVEAFCGGEAADGDLLASAALSGAAKSLLMAGWSLADGAGARGQAQAAVAFEDGMLVARAAPEHARQWMAAADALNAKCHPLKPYSAKLGEGRCEFSFSPDAALAALLGTRLAGCGWVGAWAAGGGESFDKAALKAGRLSKGSMRELAGRLWMDSADPFSPPCARPAEEMARWRMAMLPMGEGEEGAAAAWRAPGLSASPSASLAINLGLRLMGHSRAEAAGMGEATVMALSGGPAAQAASKAIEQVVAAGGAMGEEPARRFRELLAKFQSAEVGLQAGQAGHSAPSAPSARLGRSL